MTEREVITFRISPAGAQLVKMLGERTGAGRTLVLLAMLSVAGKHLPEVENRIRLQLEL